MPLVADAGVHILIDEGYELLPEAVGEMRAALDAGAHVVTGSVRVHGGDGVEGRLWRPHALTVAATLADPRGVPPVWATRMAIEADVSLGGLAWADMWVRALCAEAELPAVVVPNAVARRSLSGPTRWESLLDDPGYPALLRRFLETHQSALARWMDAVLVEREVAFGRLRVRHQQLIAERDASLRELDELRASAAHHRAFLQHHHLDGLEWGSFGRVDPVARDWGYARGGPVDRRYIRDFIASRSSDIRGRVLEVQEDDLSRAYGGCRLEQVDVVDVNAANPRATVIADLRSAPALADDTYDCIILTQTAHVIDDVDAVLRECRRVLKPGGVLLATFPCVSRVCLEYGPDADFWRVTPAGARVLVARAFGPGADVQAFGNVKTTVAFLHGLGEQELSDADYAASDPYNPMLVGVRVEKRVPSLGRSKTARGVVLAYHRIADVAHDPFDLSVSPALFEEHLRALHRRGTVVPLEQLLTADPDALPEGAVALTFDDGYVEHLTVVVPLLERLGLPATFFITTGALDTGAEHWWDLLARVNPPDVRRVHDACVTATVPERLRLLSHLRGPISGSDPEMGPRGPISGSDPVTILVSAQVRELAARPGMSIGAHGVDHLLLTRQTAEVRDREMRASRAALEAVSGAPVRLFAYPYGGVDTATASLARSLFDYACDCEPTAVRTSFDAARVPRLDVKNWRAIDLVARVDRALHPSSPAITHFLA